MKNRFFFADIPDSEKKFIVVDGIITNQPGPYSIVISRSTGLNQENTFISDAQVLSKKKMAYQKISKNPNQASIKLKTSKEFLKKDIV